MLGNTEIRRPFAVSISIEVSLIYEILSTEMELLACCVFYLLQSYPAAFELDIAYDESSIEIEQVRKMNATE